MKIKYFQDTDTVYIEFRAVGDCTDIAITVEVEACVFIKIFCFGYLVEHASDRTDIPKFSYEQITA